MTLTAARRTAPSAVLFAGLLLTHPAVSPNDTENLLPSAAIQIAAPKPRSWEETAGRFLDHALSDQLTFHGIPGAAVAVVQGGKILHLGGYGQADLEKRKPVSAETTLFRTGSVSKLCTWTAVMQLVEQGRLDLRTDVNQYLFAFQVPETYPEPITLSHLLTHTAGFEDRAFGFYAHTAGDLLPLGRFLASHMPARIFPPGEVSAYSNYGASLAGYLVEQVSGVPFEENVEMQILAPLGMADSSFRSPCRRRSRHIWSRATAPRCSQATSSWNWPHPSAPCPPLPQTWRDS